jgi:hypothetical protein
VLRRAALVRYPWPKLARLLPVSMHVLPQSACLLCGCSRISHSPSMVAKRAELAASHGYLPGGARPQAMAAWTVARPATEHQLAEPAARSTSLFSGSCSLTGGPHAGTRGGYAWTGREKITFWQKRSPNCNFLVLYSSSTLST